jgi:hypothetical protein
MPLTKHFTLQALFNSKMHIITLLALLFMAISCPAYARKDKNEPYAYISYIGCFKNRHKIENTGGWRYNTASYCAGRADSRRGVKYVALRGDTCWFWDSDEGPTLDDLVPDKKCDTPCPGWAKDTCWFFSGFNVHVCTLGMFF